MKKVTIVIVDHDNYTQSTNRRINLARKIEELGYTARHYAFIWGNDVLDNPECKPAKFVEIADVNFVHSNNTCANEFINHIFSTSPASWVVEYSGGGMEAITSNFARNEKHILYPKPIGEDCDIPKLKEFLDAVVLNQTGAADILLGFDHLLEAKLELLHSLLVPPEKQNDYQQAPEPGKGNIKKKWEAVLSFLPNGKKEKINKAWQKFLEGKPWGKFHSEPFHDDYISKDKGLLTKLRDALLPENE